MKSLSSLALITTVIILIFSLPVYSQTLAGTWKDSQYNITLVLSADGTYTLQHPNGRSQGRYGVNGNNICLQDAAATTPVCYNVVNFNNQSLVLRDSTGVTIDYRRQSVSSPALPGSSNVSASHPAPASSSKHKNHLPPSRVLARNGEHHLTGTHYNAGIGLLQFIIGQSISTGEAQQLKTELLAEFQRMPVQVIQQLTGIDQALQKVYTLTDAAQIGIARQELFKALYLATMNMPEAQKPLLIRIMNRYIKVLAIDNANNQLLTDKDAEGMVNYLAFMSQLGGQKIEVSQALRQSVVREMVGKFASMPLEQKKILCSASLMWQLMEANWKRLTPAQKQQYVTAYRQQIAQHYQVPQNTQSPPAATPSYDNTTGKKSTAQMMRDYNARQNMFNIMNQMNMNTHATSLNIIENIGGTGNYWSVVDY